MAKPWPERPVSEANKSGKQEATQWHGSSIRARFRGLPRHKSRHRRVRFRRSEACPVS